MARTKLAEGHAPLPDDMANKAKVEAAFAFEIFRGQAASQNLPEPAICRNITVLNAYLPIDWAILRAVVLKMAISQNGN